MVPEIDDPMETLEDARASIRIFYENSSDLYEAVVEGEGMEEEEMMALNMETGTAYAASSQDFQDLGEAYNDGLYVKKAIAEAATDVLLEIFDDSPAEPDLSDDPSAREIFREVEQEIFQLMNQYHAAEYQTLLASREMDIDSTAAEIAQEQTNDEKLEEAIEFNLNEAKREHIEGHLEEVNRELEKDPSETYHMFVPG